MGGNKTISKPCIKICVELFGPYIKYIIGKGPTYNIIGFFGDFIEIVSKKLGFCYVYVVSEDGLKGSQLPNGSWTGIMKQLTERKVDMSGVLNMDHSRAKAVDFSFPFDIDDMVLGYKRPVYEAEVMGFVMPYTSMTWLLILISMLAIFTGFLVIQLMDEKMNFKKEDNENMEQVSGRCTKSRVLSNTSLSVHWMLAILLSQSISKLPRGTLLQFTMGVWLLGALIVSSVYRSNLKAMLTLPSLRLPFNSLEELVQTDIPTLVVEGSTLHQALDDAAPGSTLSRLRKQAIVSNKLVEIPKRVSKGDYVVCLGRHSFQTVIHGAFKMTRSCSLYIAKEPFFTTKSIGIAFPKGSPLREKVNPILIRLKQAGILDFMLKKEMTGYWKCKSAGKANPNNDLRPLELGDFFGVFSVYAAGILLSLSAFFLEIATGYWN